MVIEKPESRAVELGALARRRRALKLLRRSVAQRRVQTTPIVVLLDKRFDVRGEMF
jgi:hypothetical protein